MPGPRAATSSGWSGSTAVSAFVTASRSGGGSVRSRGPGRAARRRDPRRLERRRVRRRAAGIAAVTVGAGRGGEERRRARPGARRADDVDALAGARSAGPGAAGARPAPIAAAARSRSPRWPSPAARSARGASRGPPRRWRACSRARSPAQTKRRTSVPAASATRDVRQADRLGGRCRRRDRRSR